MGLRAQDQLLQKLYNMVTVSAWPPHMSLDRTVDEVLAMWMACGILYERDDVSLIEDTEFDYLSSWLLERCDWTNSPNAEDFRAGSAANWESWPTWAHKAADDLLDAKLNRTANLPLMCKQCWKWVQPLCKCGTDSEYDESWDDLE